MSTDHRSGISSNLYLLSCNVTFFEEYEFRCFSLQLNLEKSPSTCPVVSEINEKFNYSVFLSIKRYDKQRKSDTRSENVGQYNPAES